MFYVRSMVAVFVFFVTITGCGIKPVPVNYLQAGKVKSAKLFEKETANLHKEVKTKIVIQQLHASKVIGVTNLEYSPDGRLIASCSNDGLIKIWDAESGNLLNNIENKVKTGKEKDINDVTFSPDGKFIATAGEDGTINIRDVLTGTILKSFPLDPSFTPVYTSDYVHARCVDFSPDGTRLAAGGYARTGDFNSYYPLKVWYIKSGKEVLSLKATDAVGHVKFSPNGKLILSGDSLNCGIELWDAQTGAHLSTMVGSGYVYSAAFSPDNQFVAGGFKGHKVMIWDLKTGTKVVSKKINGYTPKVTYSSDGKSLFIGGYDIYQMHLPTGELEVITKKSGKHIDISPDGKHLAVEDRGSIAIWDVRNKQLDFQFRDSSAGQSGGLSDSSRKIGYGYDSLNRKLRAEVFREGNYTNHHVKIYRDNKFIFSAKVPSGNQVEFSQNGKYLFVSSPLGMKRIDIVNRTVSDFSKCNGDIFDFSPDGRFVIGGNVNWTVGDIWLWDLYTNKLFRTFDGHNGRIFTLKFTDNGKTAISTGADGMTRYWNVETGALICSKMESEQKNPGNRKEWVVVTPSGHYDKSPGFEGIHFVKGLEVIELDQLFDSFYTPGLMDMVLKTGKAPKVAAEKTIDAIMDFPPPTVSIISPEALITGGKDGADSRTKTLEVVLRVTDNGGGIGEVTLFHNGKPVEGKQRGLKKTKRNDKPSQTVVFTVSLLNGKNTFMAVAKSKTGVESRPCTAAIMYKDPDLEKPDAYFVIVGINKYKNSRYNLNYGRADAEAVSALFRQKSKKLFKTLHMTELYDGKATKPNIRRALDTVVKSARPKDVFVLYYAGHGVMVENKKGEPHFYIAPHEVTALYKEKHIWANGISAKQLTGYSKKIQARKQMLIMDACQAGGFEQTFAMRGAAEEKALKQLSRSSGLYLLAATQSEQFATEFASLKHGVFTYAVLKGMEGNADGSPKDGKTTVRELSSFIEDQVPGLTEKHRGNAQYPSIYGRGQDFPILLSQ